MWESVKVETIVGLHTTNKLMPGIKSLTEPEKATVRECVDFIFSSGRFDLAADCETRIGVSVEQLKAVLSAWPKVQDEISGSHGFLVINNSLNEVCHGPDAPGAEQWAEYLSVPREQVVRIYQKWAKSLGLSHTGIQ